MGDIFVGGSDTVYVKGWNRFILCILQSKTVMHENGKNKYDLSDTHPTLSLDGFKKLYTNSLQ